VKNLPVLPVARFTLRAVIVLNWLFGAAILVLLMATIIAPQWTLTALGITPSSGIPKMIVGLRAIAVLGPVAIPLNDAVLRRLLCDCRDRAPRRSIRRRQRRSFASHRLGAARPARSSASSSAESQGDFHARPSSSPRCRVFDQRLAGRCC
jgi:hypothetical protein